MNISVTDDEDDATSSGDNDGLAEAGESIEMFLTLRNIGNFDAHNVSALLSASNQYISITSASSSFADIQAGRSVQSTTDYAFDISPDCPEGEITFILDITSDEGNWTDQFTIQVYIDIPYAPELEYSSHQIDDSTGSGDDDGFAEPGESINLPLTIRNIGDADAHLVSAVLSSSEQYCQHDDCQQQFC